VVLAIVTDRDNIYSIPEYSGGQDGKTFFHAFARFVMDANPQGSDIGDQQTLSKARLHWAVAG
jgi:hypothetical protein